MTWEMYDRDVAEWVMVSVPAPMAEPIKELVKAWREKHKARKE